MTNLFFIAIAFVCFTLLSCGYGNAIIATNKSKTDKMVRFSFPAEVALSNTHDSLSGWDLNNTIHAISVRDRYRYSVKIPCTIDTLTKTIAFTLKAGHEVNVIGATSISTIRKTFATAGYDTLKYKHKNSCWIYTIL